MHSFFLFFCTLLFSTSKKYTDIYNILTTFKCNYHIENSVKAMQVLAKRLIELQEEVERQGKMIQEKLECKDR